LKLKVEERKKNIFFSLDSFLMLSRKGEMKCEPNTNIIRASVTIDFVKKKLSEKKKDISKQVCDLIQLKKAIIFLS
jgi:hypothetical protein